MATACHATNLLIEYEIVNTHCSNGIIDDLHIN